MITEERKMKIINSYKELGLDLDKKYNISEIGKTFREISGKSHPDKNKNSETATLDMSKKSEAYEFIGKFYLTLKKEKSGEYTSTNTTESFSANDFIRYEEREITNKFYNNSIEKKNINPKNPKIVEFIRNLKAEISNLFSIKGEEGKEIDIIIEEIKINGVEEINIDSTFKECELTGIIDYINEIKEIKLEKNKIIELNKILHELELLKKEKKELENELEELKKNHANCVNQTEYLENLEKTNTTIKIQLDNLKNKDENILQLETRIKELEEIENKLNAIINKFKEEINFLELFNEEEKNSENWLELLNEKIRIYKISYEKKFSDLEKNKENNIIYTNNLISEISKLKDENINQIENIIKEKEEIKKELEKIIKDSENKTRVNLKESIKNSYFWNWNCDLKYKKWILEYIPQKELNDTEIIIMFFLSLLPILFFIDKIIKLIIKFIKKNKK